MELTPELLLEAKFGPARRGYDMAEVDDFLERCAEGLDVLLARLKAEFDRAERAEVRLSELEAGTPPADATIVEPHPADDEPAPAAPAPAAAPAVDEPMRILVHAERTAEAAISDARAEAERIRSEAETVANQQRSEAETMLATAKAEAEEEARRAGEETKRAIEAEVMTLRHDRDALSGDIRNLRRWLDEQRTRMRSTARELQRLVEDPAALSDVAGPELTGSSESEQDGDAVEAPAGDESGVPWESGHEPTTRDESTQAVPTVAPEGAVDDPWSEPDR